MLKSRVFWRTRPYIGCMYSIINWEWPRTSRFFLFLLLCHVCLVPLSAVALFLCCCCVYFNFCGFFYRHSHDATLRYSNPLAAVFICLLCRRLIRFFLLIFSCSVIRFDYIHSRSVYVLLLLKGGRDFFSRSSFVCTFVNI